MMSNSMCSKEPSDEEIKKYMEDHGKDYYTAREELRDIAYSKYHNKSANQSWGDYWKTY